MSTDTTETLDDLLENRRDELERIAESDLPANWVAQAALNTEAEDDD